MKKISLAWRRRKCGRGEILEDVEVWHNRPLEPLYPVVFPDALYVKMRHEGRVENRAVSVAIGINPKGMKEVWGCGRAGAKERSSG